MIWYQSPFIQVLPRMDAAEVCALCRRIKFPEKLFHNLFPPLSFAASTWFLPKWKTGFCSKPVFCQTCRSCFLIIKLLDLEQKILAIISPGDVKCCRQTVWPDLAIILTLGKFIKPLAKIKLPKSLKFLGNFCKGFKIDNFSSEIIFGQLLLTFGDFFLVTLLAT